MINKIFIFTILVFLVGCKNSGNQMRLFFNPSHSRALRQIHINAKINEKMVLDTMLNNRFIDKSSLLKAFYLNNSDSVVTLEINSKIRLIKIDKNSKTCIDVFSFYDDHEIIDSIFLEVEKRNAGEGKNANYSRIIDSIKASSIVGYYDRIILNVKPLKCKK